MVLNYAEEVTKLHENTNWFKPVAGQYTIMVLSEPVEKTKEFSKSDGTKEVVQQVSMTVRANGETFVWDLAKGKTQNSLFGQLCLIGQVKGKLLGETFVLLVKGSGKDKDYMIPEALSLQKKK